MATRTQQRAAAGPEPLLAKRTIARSVGALRGVLEQLRGVMERMSDAQYVACPLAGVPSSVGGHVRHALDHVAALVRAIEQGVLDYDSRVRGSEVETDRRSALAAIRSLDAALERCATASPEQPLQLSMLVEGSGAMCNAATTVGREVLFVQSHTIHHNALIAAILAALGLSPPAEFGFAPSTLESIDRSACAPSPSSR